MEPNAVGRETKLEALLASKPFDVLTPDEKVFVLEALGSEEQYHALWKIEQALKEQVPADISPNPAIIRSLQYRMKQHAPRAGIAWVFGAKFPAYATVLLILLFSIASWWMGERRSKAGTQLVERIRVDTVYLAAKADTVYRERIIYREAKIVHPPKQKVFNVAGAVSNEKPAPEVGVNMKEQQGLEVLLVSGSE
jgi:hypothetical protein